MAFSIHVVSRQ